MSYVPRQRPSRHWSALALLALTTQIVQCVSSDEADEPSAGGPLMSAAGAAGSGDGLSTGPNSPEIGGQSGMVEPIAGTPAGGAGAGGSAGDDGLAGMGTEPTNQAGEPPSMAGAGGMSVTEPGEEGIFEGITEAHNRVRAQLETSEPLPPLSWSDELAAYAQEWADELAERCDGLEHRDQGEYGENLAMSGSNAGGMRYSGEEAVASWAAEDQCWTYGRFFTTDSCNQECASELNASGCGHYTQIVWRNTERVGCGYSTCETNGFQLEIWVCNYDPPGNFVDQVPY